jgi:hypothetical protein
VMTIGVVGALLIYLPLVASLVHCMRRSSRAIRDRFSWMNYGAQIWILAALGSSITLVSLFSPSGLVLTAVILAVLSQPFVLGIDREAVEPEDPLAAPAAPPAVAAGFSDWGAGPL